MKHVVRFLGGEFHGHPVEPAMLHHDGIEIMGHGRKWCYLSMGIRVREFDEEFHFYVLDSLDISDEDGMHWLAMTLLRPC